MARTVMNSELSSRFFDKTEELFRSGELHREINELCLDLQDKTVLDLAAGTGHWEEVFLSMGAKKVIWQDLSGHFYRVARCRLQSSDKVDFYLSDMVNVPMGNESVDFVMCRDSLYHSPDEKKTLAEVYRVLKAGGCLYLTSRNWRRIFRERASIWSPLKLLSPHIYRIAGRKVIPTAYLLCGYTVQLLQGRGFTVEKVRGEDSSFSILARKQ